MTDERERPLTRDELLEILRQTYANMENVGEELAASQRLLKEHIEELADDDGN